MIYNSFNRVLSFEECSCPQYHSKDKSGNKPDNNKILNNKDWESKYDISIVVLHEEYLQCLNRIRNVDEKANKYFLVISLMVTGLFVVLSSSATEHLEFDHLASIIAFLLTLLLICFFICICYLGVVIFASLLGCFKLVETKRMPNISKLLDKSEQEDSIQYKSCLIASYQDCVEKISVTLTEKQSHIKKVSEKISFFTAFVIASLIILTSLKVLN